ncbi:MAG: hypothetical protein H8E55_08190 [Pelagibacterales bacterium]|nr:hypothetical protein [Pelagibacterales bacterium]
MKNYTREDAQTLIRKEGTPDYMLVEGILFTMEEYDEKGRYINYLNRSHWIEMEVVTSNRYGEMEFSDADVQIRDSNSYRVGFSYLDEITTGEL